MKNLSKTTKSKITNKFRYILFVIMLFTGLQTNFVYGQNKIRITLINPPPNQLSVRDVWKMTLSNLTDSTVNFYVKGKFEKDSAVIADSRSVNIALPPNDSISIDYRNFDSGTVNWYDNTLKEFILRTGNVPAGLYTVCATPYSSESDSIIGLEQCITQHVLRPPELEIPLISPVEADSISLSDTITFQWSGYPLMAGESYALRIVELIGDQYPAVAMAFDSAVDFQYNILTTTFRYPEVSRKFSGGRKYAWRIELMRDTVIVSYSDIRTFRIMDMPLPVEILSFSCNINQSNTSLYWTTSSETNNSGFEIERLEVKGQTSDVWSRIGFVNGHGTTTSQNNYEFRYRNLSSGKYSYRLKQIDFNGNYEYFNLTEEVVIGVPDKFELSQNYPNPFNPVTNLEFGISNLEFVSLKVYDAMGKEVATLVNEIKPAGRYNVTFDGSNIGSGVYFYRLEAGNFSDVKSMILIK